MVPVHACMQVVQAEPCLEGDCWDSVSAEAKEVIRWGSVPCTG